MKLWKTKNTLALCVMVLCLFWPGVSRALTLEEVDGKEDGQLEAENWETRDVKANKGNVRCGLLSILLSTFWRGYGHYCIGDDSSHYKLLAMEGASVGMLTVALLTGALSNDDKSLSAVWKSLFHFGTTLFVSSYIFDVLGTFKGDTFNFDANHLDPYGHSIDVQLRWLPSSDFNLGLALAYVYRNERFWISPYGFADVVNWNNFSAGLDLGVAVWYGKRTHTYVAIAADSKFEEHLKTYRILRITPYIEFSLDLGSWFHHLAELRFVNRLGVGVTLYDFEIDGVSPFGDYDTQLVLETALSLNLIKDLNFALTYRYRPDYYVGQISAPSRIFGTLPVPGVGIFSMDINFSIFGGWHANVSANFGQGIDFWLGASKNF